MCAPGEISANTASCEEVGEARKKTGREQRLFLPPPSPRILLWPEKHRQLLVSVLSLSSGVCSPRGGWGEGGGGGLGGGGRIPLPAVAT